MKLQGLLKDGGFVSHVNLFGDPPLKCDRIFALGAMAGVNMVHVPYKGGRLALTELIGGQVSLMFGSMIDQTVPGS